MNEGEHFFMSHNYAHHVREKKKLKGCFYYKIMNCSWSHSGIILTEEITSLATLVNLQLYNFQV